ncbi:MAG: amylo-alpha-1,6-glucosidase [Planctomycetes bacterium]|nr:amylo-alpha-1,6-glucosidase [Planctomycetota bacterium]
MAEPLKPFIELRPTDWPDAASAAGLEWLSTNGIGGYSYGTVSGALQRRWHGLLVAATDPPEGRTLLVSKVEVTATTGGTRTSLTANQWTTGMDAPGLTCLSRVWLDGSIVVREWKIGSAILEERIAMARGRNTVAIVFALRDAKQPVELELKCLVNHRLHNQLTKPKAFVPRIAGCARGLQVSFDHASGEGRDLHLQADRGAGAADGSWYENYFLPAEQALGYDFVDAHCCAGVIRLTIKPGETRGFTAGTRDEPEGEAGRIINAAAARSRSLIALAKAESDPFRGRLALAADQFIIERTLPDGSRGSGVIAGYPWFGQWSRDTLIALPGLCLETGRFEEAASMVRSLAKFEKDGLLPNRFPSPGEAWMDNSVDAPLLLATTARRIVNASGNFELARDLFPALESIFNAFSKGTRHGIRIDPTDGLLIATDPGTQLTWMDAKLGAKVITPRMGKPVEINALWCGLLATLIEWAPRLKKDASPWSAALDKSRRSFTRFLHPDQDRLFDTLDGPDGADDSLRPNQLFAIQALAPLVPDAIAKRIVARVERELHTPLGLRTLASNSPGYVGRFGGAVEDRDRAYHNGTVWPWLLGPLAGAMRTLGQSARVADLHRPFEAQLSRNCLGQVFEVTDGDPPQRGGGCAAQAWSVASLLDRGVGE